MECDHFYDESIDDLGDRFLIEMGDNRLCGESMDILGDRFLVEIMGDRCLMLLRGDHLWEEVWML